MGNDTQVIPYICFSKHLLFCADEQAAINTNKIAMNYRICKNWVVFFVQSENVFFTENVVKWCDKKHNVIMEVTA